MKQIFTIIGICLAIGLTSIASILLIAKFSSDNAKLSNENKASLVSLCRLVENLAVQTKLSIDTPPVGDTPAKLAARIVTYNFETKLLASPSCR